MSGKFRRFAQHLFDVVKPGGVERSTLGTSINVSSNGTSTVPANDLEKIVFQRFADMKPRKPPAEVSPSTASESKAG